MKRQVDDTLDFLSGGGEMSERIRAYDWSRTALGSLETWPQSLKTALKIALNTRYPIWMGWGSDLVFFYNTAYTPFIGKRHEWALGASAREVWRESWDEHLGPQADAVLVRGEASWNDQHQLIAYRNGYAEEVYFTYSYSPLPADEGGVGGLFCACTEDTQRVLGERRLAALRHLAAATADARTEAQAALVAARTMAEHDADVSFALIYLISPDGSTARLAPGSSDLHDVRWAPPDISLLGNGNGRKRRSDSWPLKEAMDDGMQVLRDIVPERGLPGGRWPEATSVAAVAPLAKAGDATPRGFLVVGASPRLPFDENYRSFFELLARGTADALSNAHAYEEERKRAEALAALDQAKTAFFSNVSHEFRTPLTLMLGPVEELLDKGHADLSSSAKGQLEIVKRNGLRLLRLVNSLLDFSRIEAGRVRARYELTDLSAFTAELASSFRSATERAGLKLIVDCPPLSESIYIDRDMWEKVVLNLISNAFKFTFDGQILVTMRQQAGGADLVVRDTGVGIPAEALPKLFERFYRVENMRSRTHEGSGIGLALVQELVKLHGGSVRADSKMGEGSSFTITIPFGYAHLPADQIGGVRTIASTVPGVSPFVEEALRWLPDKSQDEHDGAPLQDAIAVNRPRILVVDDNADMRQYVVRLLSDRYEVEAAADGQAALTAVHARRPDLVLSDVMLPRLDGLGLLRALRQDPSLKTLPIILLSARAGEESRVEGLERGADDYLIKPFSARELLARVQAHLDLAHLRYESHALKVRHMSEDRRRVEARLQESEERWRAVFENSAVGIAVTDLNGRFLATNSAYERMLGYSADEFRALNFMDITHEDDRDRNRVLVTELLGGVRDQFQIEKRYRRKDGTAVWVRNSVSLAPGSENVPVAIMAIVEDIRDRKRAEELLRSSERRLRAIVENIPASIAIHGPSGELEFENRAAREYHGRISDDVQQSPASVVHPDDVPALVAAQQRALTTGEPLEFELRVRRADGAYRWFHMRSRRSSDDHDGSSRWYTVGTDIHDRKTAEEALRHAATERSLAEEALRESERHSRLIVDNIPGLFGLLTAEGRLEFLNRQVLDYTGMTMEELKRSGTRDTIHPDDLPHVMQVFTHSIAGGRPYEMVWRFRRSDGVYRWFQNNGYPVRDTGGHIVGWCVLMTDIDERKRAEDALHRMQARLSHATQIAAVGEMTGSIAHEVNQPLAAVVANGHACLRWLSASPPNVAKAIEAAERIVKDGKDAGEVVRRVRGLFKRSAVERAALDLGEVIREVLRLLDSYPARKHVSLDVELDPDLPSVFADRVQLQQLVLNLMVNALEALEPVSGRPKQLSVRSTRAEPNHAVIEISDNGIGLDDPSAAFEPFVTTKPEGMGLGLAICRSIVAAQEGTLSAQRNAGFGTTFTVTLPLRPEVSP